jgi:thioredoxin
MATKQQFSSFTDLLTSSDIPILVDFYAPWCGPCQMMAGILAEVNAQMQPQLKVVKINVDNYPAIASQYQIAALPTLVLFKQGQPVQRIEGVVKANQLIQQLRSLLAATP